MARFTKSVCVYCGSRDGAKPAYAKAAEALGALLAKRDWRLVYGAGDVGLMGRVARTVQSAGGVTFGVIPTHLLDWEVGKRDLDTFVITETMHERKKVMLMNADAVVVLPGGAGSTLLDHVIAESFAGDDILSYVQIVDTVEELEATLDQS